jgi:quinol monooxygenase YgiN
LPNANFCVVYRFDVVDGMDDAFVEAWAAMTEILATHGGALGSRLHRDADGRFVAYAQWPSRDAWEATPPLPGGDAARAAMRATLRGVEVLHTLDTTRDVLRPVGAPAA